MRLATPIRPACAVLLASRRSFHSAHTLYGEATPRSEKVERLTTEIASLTLLEAAELTESLKERLGVKDVMMAAPSAAAPAAAPAAAAAPVEAAPEKTAFTVVLESFNAADKIKLIKEVRAITGLGLKEAKEAVEGAPKTLKADIKKAEADEIKAKLEAAGGKVKLE